MFMSYLYVLLGKVSIQVLCPFLIGLFVFLVLSCMNSLCILEIKPLSDVSLSNMFFHILSSLFILMMVSLPVQKLFNLMYSYLFLFFLYFLCLGDISAKILLCGISEILLPMFSSRSSIMPQLIFKSFVHFEFILVYGVSLWSSLISLHVPVQFSQNHVLKRLSLLHCMLMPLCQILIDHRDMGLFLGSLFCSIDLCVCSYAHHRLFGLQWPCSVVWCWVLWSLLLCSSFTRLFRLFRSFLAPYKFLKYLFYICEICDCYFNRNCVESIECFG